MEFRSMKLGLKGQTTVISYILVLGVVIASISAAYMWGVPLLKKGEASSKVEAARNAMFQLKKELDSVVSVGGQRSITLDVYGTLFVSEEDNSIHYLIYTPKTKYAVNITIPLSSYATFGVIGTEEENGTAFFGLDEPSVLMVKVMPAGSGYLVDYRLALRELADTETGDGYLNKFEVRGNSKVTEGRHEIVISKGPSVRGGVSSLEGMLINTSIYISIY